MRKLEVNAPGKARLNYILSDEEVVFGRTENNTITLPFDNVSRHHAGVRLFGEDYYLEDKGSTNGTYVNGVKIAKCRLNNHDLIQIGETKIYYVEEDQSPPPENNDGEHNSHVPVNDPSPPALTAYNELPEN